MRRRILPTIVLGSSVRNTTAVGTLYLATWVLQNSMISSSHFSVNMQNVNVLVFYLVVI